MIVHVRTQGIKVVTFDYEAEKHAISKVEIPEYKGLVDYIKTTPDGRFVIIGLPNANTIKFMEVDK